MGTQKAEPIGACSPEIMLDNTTKPRKGNKILGDKNNNKTNGTITTSTTATTKTAKEVSYA